MNTQKKSINQAILILAAILFLLFALLYLARGWVRNGVLPVYYQQRHSAGITAVLQGAYGVMSEPLDATIKKQTDPKCELAAAKGINTQIDCWASIAFTGKEPVSSTEAVSNQLVLLQRALQDDGWVGATDLADWGISITAREGTAQGYHDIRKSQGSLACTLSLLYDKEFYGTIQCVRNAYFLGNPNILFSS